MSTAALVKLRRSLIRTHGNGAPGAVLVEESVYVQSTNSVNLPFVATYKSQELARAALVAAGWIADTVSTLVYWPQVHRYQHIRPPQWNKGMGEGANVRDWVGQYSFEGAN